MTRIGLALVVLVLAGCSCGGPHGGELDAATDDTGTDDAVLAVDTATDTAADVGTTARCTSPSTTSWSLANAEWSTDFAPRGLSGGRSPAPIRLAFVTAHDGEVFLAGDFDHAGPVAARNVAAWSPSHGFRALGDGLDSDYVGPLVVRTDGTVLAVRGRYDAMLVRHYVLEAFVGAAWTSIAEDDHPMGLALDVDGSVIVIGSFTSFAGVPANGLARWDGTHVTAIDAPRGGVDLVLADASGVCMSGHDTLGSYVTCRAAGDTAWVDQALPDPAHATVYALAHDATGALLAGGILETAPGSRIGGVLRREGGTWMPLGGGLLGGGGAPAVSSLALFDDGGVVALGDFDRAAVGGEQLSALARWTGTHWERVGALYPFSLRPMAMAASGDDLFVVGGFVEAYGDHAVSALGVARWDGVSWHGLDVPGALTLGNAGISRVAVDSACTTYVGGAMRAAGDLPTDYSAVRHGDAWSPLSGLRGEPSVLAAAPDGTVYAAGLTSGLTEPTTPYFARLNGSVWDLVPAATNGIEAITFAPDGTTYVAMERIVYVLDGDTLTPLGDREPTQVGAMLVTSSGLLVADANSVDRWDGAQWTTVSDLSFVPSAMIAWNGHVVIGGRFGLGFLEDGRIQAVLFPQIESAQIVAMAGVGRQLVAVGRRTSSAGAIGVAAWSDEHGTWHELGFDGPVDDVTALDGALLFAGDFTTVDGVASTGIARLEAR